MKNLSPAIAHAKTSPQREVCGVVIEENGEEVYIPCRNIATKDMEFAIHPEDWEAAKTRGHIAEIFHSHPNGTPQPSMPDLVECEKHGIPWTIVGLPSCRTHTFSPTGYRAPLYGRKYAFGVLDCWTLARDWYAQEAGILLPAFQYSEAEWKGTDSLFRKYAEEGGFFEISGKTLRRGDLILFNLQSRCANHCGVYLGDMLFLHHLTTEPSKNDIFGASWKMRATGYFRHKGLV